MTVRRSPAALLVLAVLTGACSGSEPAAPPTPAGLRLVSLGDSTATGSGDESGQGGWVPRYAGLLEGATGAAVEVSPRAVDGTTSAQLRQQLRSDARLRDAVAGADAVVVAIGGADLGAGDDAWAAGYCSGPPCYEPSLQALAEDVEAVAATVTELRAGRPTLLRVVTSPNILTGAGDALPPFLRTAATEVGVAVSTSQRSAGCQAARAHGGECLDLLGAFNGPDGTQDAYARGLLNRQDCCYPSALGHQRIAELLAATGTTPAPLR